MPGPPLLDVWPPLPPAGSLGRRRKERPFPLDDPGARLFGWARQALFAGVRAVGLGPGDEVLVPAYHHGSEVEALRRAGVSCRFYDAGDSLSPDPEELEGVLGGAVRALYLIHYLGFPQDAAGWRRWCEERGLLLIEDAAQAWLAETPAGPAGAFGHVSIFCLYKSVGLPEGGVVVSEPAVADPGLDRRYGAGALARRHTAWLASRARPVADGVAAVLARRRGEYDPAEDFALREHGDQAWRSVPKVLDRLELSSVAARRRENYRVLLAALEPHVPPPFRSLPSGASPFAFPVGAADKPALIERLLRRRVRTLDFWSVPHPALDAGRHPGAADRRARTVALPVHQELRRADVERVAEEAREAFASAPPRPRWRAGAPPPQGR